jgi:hypothetical protein
MPEWHGFEIHPSQVRTRSLAPSGYLLTVTATSSIRPRDTTSEQQCHLRCIPQCLVVLTHIELWQPMHQPAGHQAAQDSFYDSH